MLKIIKKYLPDFLILMGIFFLTEFGIHKLTRGAILGIMLVAIGIDIAIRKYVLNKFN